ncbi:hypothetical protein ABW20_dc0109219 [Dactylellina cionopaga]|nr:hypothetical protein ABW20_dc0109219 [Dactylellina cionopaga]
MNWEFSPVALVNCHDYDDLQKWYLDGNIFRVDTDGLDPKNFIYNGVIKNFKSGRCIHAAYRPNGNYNASSRFKDLVTQGYQIMGYLYLGNCTGEGANMQVYALDNLNECVTPRTPIGAPEGIYLGSRKYDGGKRLFKIFNCPSNGTPTLILRSYYPEQLFPQKDPSKPSWAAWGCENTTFQDRQADGNILNTASMFPSPITEYIQEYIQHQVEVDYYQCLNEQRKIEDERRQMIAVFEQERHSLEPIIAICTSDPFNTLVRTIDCAPYLKVPQPDKPEGLPGEKICERPPTLEP